jgi:hypothetical protein
VPYATDEELDQFVQDLLSDPCLSAVQDAGLSATNVEQTPAGWRSAGGNSHDPGSLQCTGGQLATQQLQGDAPAYILASNTPAGQSIHVSPPPALHASTQQQLPLDTAPACASVQHPHLNQLPPTPWADSLMEHGPGGGTVTTPLAPLQQPFPPVPGFASPAPSHTAALGVGMSSGLQTPAAQLFSARPAAAQTLPRPAASRSSGPAFAPDVEAMITAGTREAPSPPSRALWPSQPTCLGPSTVPSTAHMPQHNVGPATVPCTTHAPQQTPEYLGPATVPRTTLAPQQAPTCLVPATSPRTAPAPQQTPEPSQTRRRRPAGRGPVRSQDAVKAADIWRRITTGQGLEGVPVLHAPPRDPTTPGAPR